LLPLSEEVFGLPELKINNRVKKELLPGVLYMFLTAAEELNRRVK
jgi:hypothetical protein